ncbi:MAG: mechanosensitive ion channel [Ruminococcaceae bacterium]|nr:mechanosensitive ion channel [Oscillospiraceae bacterium]
MDFLKRIFESMKDFVVNRWNAILVFVLVLIFGIVAVKVITNIFKGAMNRSKLKGAAGDFLTSIVRVLLLIIYLIALLSLLGIPTTSIVAMFTAFSLAISLALQNTFSNVAAGITIIMNKPFEEGDFVDIGGTVGTVETITISSTKLTTGDNRLVVIPNGTVSGSTVINYSTKGTRRLDLTVSAAYGTDVELVKSTVLDVIAKHEEIFKTPAPMVRLSEHGASSIDFVVRVWLEGKDYWPVNFDLKEEIYRAFNEKGIEIPFPQMDVHVVK